METGNNSKIEANDIIIRNDVTMGADIIIYSSSHEYKDLGIPINQQAEKPYNNLLVEVCMDWGMSYY